MNYAESDSRLVYAFVFGHDDSCRVFRRAAAPALPPQNRRLGAEYRGEPGDVLLAEFSFGRGGRPMHMVLPDDGTFLGALANRSPEGGLPRQDAVYAFRDGKAERAALSYEGLPPPLRRASWPAHPRALAASPEEPDAEEKRSATYVFSDLEVAPGRILVARWSETADRAVFEPVCFLLDPAGKAELPEASELRALLEREEGLWRAGAAWALGVHEDPRAAPALRHALGRAEHEPVVAAIAEALVRCGGKEGYPALARLLESEVVLVRRSAARALATLPPDPRTPGALAHALCDADEDVARDAGIALAHLGGDAVTALARPARDKDPELRKRVARVLGRMHAAAAEDRLLDLACDKDEGVQGAAAVALTSPPRALLPENHRAFARALLACGRAGNRRGTHRLSILAAHAEIRDDAVLGALVELTALEPRAIWALRRLAGDHGETPEAWRAWWESRQRR